MGAYAPAPVYTDEVKQKTIQRIVEPMHKALSNRRVPYRGVLYVGLMIDENNDPYVVEFNVRFGDPECQITIPLIATDLGDLLYSASKDKLSTLDVNFHDKHAMTVVLAAENYPGPVEKGREIKNLPNSTEDSWVNHAGTKSEQGLLLSNGGRVLSFARELVIVCKMHLRKPIHLSRKLSCPALTIAVILAIEHCEHFPEKWL